MVNAVKGTIRCLAVLTVGAASMAILLHEPVKTAEITVPYQIVGAMK